MLYARSNSRSVRAAILATAMLALSWSVAACQDAAPTQPAVAADQSESRVDAVATVNKQFDALLKDIVTKDGLVRYQDLRSAERRAALKSVVDGYGNAPLPEQPKARLALWCNAYNANVLQNVLAATADPTFESVVKVEGFFDVARIQVAGDTMTLNDLENLKIRKLNDPRIHAALVCAAVSCPPLRMEAYDAERLDAQFDDQCRRWVNDAAKFGRRGDRLAVSKILDWYGDDFKGGRFADIATFVRTYASADSDIAALLAEDSAPTIEWLPYDWALNQAPTDS